MIYKFEFNSKEEKHAIEKNNSDKYLIEEQYLIDGNFLVYTDEPTEIELIKEKISILEAENESLKEGLRAVLRGDMQSLAYILYPEDFDTFQKVGV